MRSGNECGGGKSIWHSILVSRITPPLHCYGKQRRSTRTGRNVECSVNHLVDVNNCVTCALSQNSRITHRRRIFPCSPRKPCNRVLFSGFMNIEHEFAGSTTGPTPNGWCDQIVTRDIPILRLCVISEMLGDLNMRKNLITSSHFFCLPATITPRPPLLQLSTS